MTFSNLNIAYLSLSLAIFSFQITVSSLHNAYLSLNLTLFSFQMNGLRACRGRTAILRTLSIPNLGDCLPSPYPSHRFLLKLKKVNLKLKKVIFKLEKVISKLKMTISSHFGTRKGRFDTPQGV